MQDAPDVAENHVIEVGDLAQTADLPNALRLLVPHQGLG